ncbi:MAG TPA: efflux RND transporter periplasmic adaptor subunit [Gammaproteobacteria bacterium]|nr:efflux RND transporter periplasmic adaptor subunit [Gammaproteobacteria bacterium]
MEKLQIIKGRVKASYAKAATHPHFRKIAFGCGFVVLVLLFFGLSTQLSRKKPPVTSAVPVVLAPVQTSEMPIYLSALGSVIPTDTVTVISQINGKLLKVYFNEGQWVKEGELLAEIDSLPYQAQLTQYEGQLARDTALLANAGIDLKRYQTLYKQDSVSEQTLETQKWLVKQYEGDVKIDQGLLEGVQVSLKYCRITSPINGRIGLRFVDPGNFVQTSGLTGLFVINTIQPITVVFSIPEDNLPAVMEKVIHGNSLKTEAYDRAQNRLLDSGVLLTVDNQIDPTTGTVKLKANFSNENNTLFPNQFVNVKLLVDTLKSATVLPTAAIQHGEKSAFVYVLNKDKTVSVKPVTVIATYVDHAAIAEKALVGQVVVLEGADKLTEGASVIPTQQNKPVTGKI